MDKFIKVLGALLILCSCGGCAGTLDDDALYTEDGCYLGSVEDIAPETTRVVASACDLEVGDIYVADLGDEGVGSIDLSCVAKCSKYSLALVSYDFVNVGDIIQLQVTAAGGSQNGTSLQDVALNMSEQNVSAESSPHSLDQWLRKNERIMAAQIRSKSKTTMTDGLVSLDRPSPEVGQVETLQVLKGNNNLAGCEAVEAEVLAVGDYVACYLDRSIPAEYIDQVEMNRLCGIYDSIAEYEHSLFGKPSDVDNDGLLHVLMTYAVNRQNDPTTVERLAGFFYSGDLYPIEKESCSNEREMLYMIAPDPDGLQGPVEPVNTILGKSPALFAHEYQHAINFNQRVIVNNLTRHDAWLNEGMSQLIEDLSGYNYGNYDEYQYFLISSPNGRLYGHWTMFHASYGASYLLLRYLYEQADDKTGFLRAIMDGSDPGIDNLMSAIAARSDITSTYDMMLRWTAAMIMSDKKASKDPRYSYASPVQNPSTGYWGGICISCSLEMPDGNVLLLEGIREEWLYGEMNSEILATTAKYYNVDAVPEQIEIQVPSKHRIMALLVRYK